MDNSVIFSIGLEKKMQLDKLAPKFENVETFQKFLSVAKLAKARDCNEYLKVILEMRVFDSPPGDFFLNPNQII